MRNIKALVTISVLAISGYSCVEPFNIESIDFDNAIVVEGRITNESKAHYVKLSYTRPIDDEKNTPLSGATVWVEDANGSMIDFGEVEPGHYKSGSSVCGVVGNSYRLHFITPEGSSYQSSFQELVASPPIDSIYDAYAERSAKNASEMNKGIQFFVDTHDELNAARYFKYEWEETYEVHATYPSVYKFSSDPDTVVIRTEEVNPCYESGSSSSIILGTTANLTENRLSEMPVRYITSETDQLRYAYSILVKQYAVSAEAYGFYREIVANNKGTGSLFDKQLGTVAGNITSAENPDETVLGFFEVSGVSEKRAFVKFEDLDPRYPWPRSKYTCANDRLLTVIDSLQPLPYKLEDSVRTYVGQGYGIITVSYCDSLRRPQPQMPPCSFYATVRLAPNYCTDCRFRGPAGKPEFWIY